MQCGNAFTAQGYSTFGAGAPSPGPVGCSLGFAFFLLCASAAGSGVASPGPVPCQMVHPASKSVSPNHSSWTATDIPRRLSCQGQMAQLRCSQHFHAAARGHDAHTRAAGSCAVKVQPTHPAAAGSAVGTLPSPGAPLGPPPAAYIGAAGAGRATLLRIHLRARPSYGVRIRGRCCSPA